MLRQWNSRTPLLGDLRERECPRCHRPVDLPLGEICPVCQRDIQRRASRIARAVALLSTVAVGAWVLLRVPPDPTARLVSGVAVAIWYVLTNLVVRRVLREFLR